MTRGKRGDEIRWAFLEGLDIGADNDPYLDRLRIVQTPWFGIYLHHIHRPDRENDPHDHPWWFTSLVLAGSYRESVWPDKTVTFPTWIVRKRGRWSLRSLNRNMAHIITEVNGPLWTLVLVGPRMSDWGFWQEGRYIPFHEYPAGDP